MKQPTLVSVRGAIVGAAGLFLVLGFALASSPTHLAAQQVDAKTHLQWMDDAGDTQEDLRDAFAQKDAAKVAEASGKLEKLMQQTEAYWQAKKASADVLKIAKETRDLNAQMTAAAGKKDLAAAQKAFDDLSAKCNACHDLHPEKK